MLPKQLANGKPVGWMTPHPSTSSNHNTTVEENSVFHPTERCHD